MLITRAAPEHEEQILTLATRTLGWEDDPRYAAMYRWKHDENPFGASPRWVALDDDRVVGFRVFLRWRFVRPNGEVVEAVRAVDTATDPDHQGRGIFRSLTTQAVDELRADGVELVFNTPNDQSRPGYLKMGWTELGRPPVAMAPRLRSLARIARSRTAADLWSIETSAGRAAPTYLGDSAEEASIAELLAATDATRWRTDRSPTWLAWRYGFERLGYRVVTTDDLSGAASRTRGFAVFRLRRRGPSVEATIAEVLSTSPRTARALVRAVRRATRADYALVASDAAVDATPSVSLPSFSPLVTWRELGEVPKPPLGAVRLGIGDLELF